MCGGWTPCLHLFSHTKGSLAWDETLRPSSRARSPRPCTSPAPAAASGHSKAPTAPPPAARPCGTPAARRRRRPTPSPPTRTGSGVTLKELPTDRNPARPRPSSTSRTTSPPRTSASLSAKACARSSTLDHQRHGDRPGQDVEHQRPDDRRRRARQGAAAGRPHHLPAALHPTTAPSPATTRTGRSTSPARPRSTPGPRPTAPPSSRSRSGAAPGTSRRLARTCTRRGPRVPRHPRLARHLRRLDPRQDRGRGAGRRRLHGADVHQPLGEARSAAAATACCSARTASSATTA